MRNNKNIQLNNQTGVHIVATPGQMVVVAIMFVVFFVAPIISYEYYYKAPDTQNPLVEETYTRQALELAQQDQTNQGQVAGLATSRVEGQSGVRIPLLDVSVDGDFSKPSNLFILIGGVLGFVSVVIFIRLVLEPQHI